MPYELHPACAAWPPMADEQLQKLADDIKINGLLEQATITNDNLMLDGRNRDKACEMAEVELRTVIYEGDNEISFVISKNLHRRHLPLHELATIGADLATLKHGTNQFQQKKMDVSRETSSTITKSAEIIANELGITRSAIMDAKAIKEHATPEVAALKGKVGLRDLASYSRNTPKDKQKPDITEIRRKGDAINRGKLKGKKQTNGKPQEHKSQTPIPQGHHFLDMTKEDTKGLDPNQRVHLHSFTAKQMIDAQSLVTEMLNAIIQCGRSTNPDADVFFASLDRLLTWTPKPGAKFGEQIDFAKRARQSLRDLDQVLPAAFIRLQAFHAQWLARKKPRLVGG